MGAVPGILDPKISLTRFNFFEVPSVPKLLHYCNHIFGQFLLGAAM